MVLLLEHNLFLLFLNHLFRVASTGLVCTAWLINMGSRPAEQRTT